MNEFYSGDHWHCPKGSSSLWWDDFAHPEFGSPYEPHAHGLHFGAWQRYLAGPNRHFLNNF